MTLAIFLIVLIAGIFLGIPVAFSLLLSAIVLMTHLGMLTIDTLTDGSNILAQSLINGVDNFSLLAIPFFMVAGEIMSVGGLSQRIVRLAMVWVGHRKGGLGYVAIITSVLLAGLSGSAVADAAALISILFPMMRKANYPEDYSAGLLGAGGIIAPVIPPSLPLILIGVAGNISIARLFLGGIVPGLLMGLALMFTWRYIVKSNTAIATSEKASGAERIKALREGIWALLLPVIIIGGIKSGIFTPTEAAVVAAVYAILISTFVYREMSLEAFYKVMVSSGRATGMVMFLVGAAMVAAWVMTVAQLPQQVAGMLHPLIGSPRLLMAAIMVLILIIGMFMDLAPTVLIMVPLLLPVTKAAGIDPVYFGLMFVINSCIGLLTPPVGNVLNVVCGVGKVRLDVAVRGLAPFILVYTLLLTLFVIFPQIIIWPLKIIAG